MNTPVFTALRLQNVRSYSDFAIELSPTVNIVVGPNASGKTNLLESLLILCGSPSYRASYSDIIASGADWARIDGSVVSGSRVVKLTRIANGADKLYELNEKPKKRLNFNDTLPVVLFEPENMRLLTGGPDLRRDFFDGILAETKPEFLGLSQRYKRVLAQRNRLLKNPGAVRAQAFAWNVRLSELAGQIVASRLELLGNITSKLSEQYSEIASKKTQIGLDYKTKLSTEQYESVLLKKLESTQDEDVMRGYTAHGPHREDFSFTINGQPADVFASRGETRTLVLALKLLELDLLQKSRNQNPLVLLDDVFSELDGSRRIALTDYLKDHQVLITTTDADVVQKDFMQKINRISL
jgi:DNA replication and repair protein RecF